MNFATSLLKFIYDNETVFPDSMRGFSTTFLELDIISSMKTKGLIQFDGFVYTLTYAGKTLCEREGAYIYDDPRMLAFTNPYLLLSTGHGYNAYPIVLACANETVVPLDDIMYNRLRYSGVIDKDGAPINNPLTHSLVYEYKVKCEEVIDHTLNTYTSFTNFLQRVCNPITGPLAQSVTISPEFYIGKFRDEVGYHVEREYKRLFRGKVSDQTINYLDIISKVVFGENSPEYASVQDEIIMYRIHNG